MCAWVTPETWATSKALSVARLNEQLRDNMQYVYDLFIDSAFRNLAENGHFWGWMAGAAAAPDKWTLAGAGAAVAREAATFQVDTYSAKVTNGAGNAATLVQTIRSRLVPQLRNSSLALSVRVYSTTSRTYVQIGDGTTTAHAHHSGAAGWEVLTATIPTVAAAAATITITLGNDAGDAVAQYFDGVMLVNSAVPTVFSNSPLDFIPRLSYYQSIVPTNFTLSGGLLMQIGESPAAGGDITVTFPVAFSASPHIILCVGQGGANTYWISTPGVASFIAKRVGAVSSDVYWLAIGKE